MKPDVQHFCLSLKYVLAAVTALTESDLKLQHV